MSLQGANGKIKYQLCPDDADPVGAARQCDVLQAMVSNRARPADWELLLLFRIAVSVCGFVVFQISACSVAGSICVNLQS